MRNIIKKIINESHALAWTIAGTALVLITLSGDVKKYGIYISVIALLVHLFGVLVKKEES